MFLLRYRIATKDIITPRLEIKSRLKDPQIKICACFILRPLAWKRKWTGMKMASCLVPQGFPVRSGCIDKMMPPEKREALWGQ